MTNQAQEHISQLTNHKRIKFLDISNRDLSGTADLKEFTGLINLNSSNNKFENLDFLNTLPNKEQLKSLNFFGNQIKEIDLAHLLSTFPKLEYLNCENNPLSAKNLDKMTSEQFAKLKLIKSGDSSQQQQAQQLQAILQSNSIKNEQQPTNSKLP
ncbi:9703_t:CDS:2 [Ambispora gerdemannii]|uniref:9703_t:CDS:1 n=1 Tax=Ambispora gerdemannii TaxID=144530 RepID=A0A9N9AG10_9GLOM|nr:9703_t:CDS:2 [Ambispora gerdemannii]